MYKRVPNCGGGGGVRQVQKKKNSCTPLAEEIKIVHSGTKQRNILQASEIKFIQSFLQKKIAQLPLPPQKYNGPSLI